MSVEIRVGQKLKTLKDDYATVEQVGETFIIVSYNGQKLKRDRSIVGTKLFVAEKVIQAPERLQMTDGTTPRNDEATCLDFSLPEKTCENCFLLRAEDCFGGKTICDLYRYAPSLSKAETDRWPKEADASRFRRTGKKR